MPDLPAQPDGAPTIHTVEFRGRGGEYFRIWIVNIALSVLTLGIYTAWAKVRTQRYFYGNTYLAGHSFEYHASAWRILIGRAIALTLFLGYSLSVVFVPLTFGIWFLILGAALPWLANTSTRFGARNTSWRNVRFNFNATYFETFIAYVVWSVAALAFFPLIPYARRVHDYFYINHHRFGGRGFETAFAARRIYFIYLFGFILIVVLLLAVIAIAGAAVEIATHVHNVFGRFSIPLGPENFSLIVLVLFGIGTAFVASFVTTLVTNLSVSNATLEGGFKLSSKASGLRVAWIVVTNALLTLATLGLFYPFGRVRLARYRMRKYALIASGNLDDFTSEALEAQSAIGQEIAGFFDLGFGL
ncbi:MAG: YjgN family protein [Rhizomicrobium sp.]